MNIKDKLQQHLVMSMFATQEDLYEELNKQREEALIKIIELEARLEIDPRTKYDGIDCRDATIKELESDEIVKDARRYRWLKYSSKPGEPFGLLERMREALALVNAYNQLCKPWNGWDESIDEAIAKA